ncbi:RNA-binding protein 26 isoform X2 [Homalodisca vitripennis]|uniref:RNA-binding protein 26 isoform X2 n=1 Tax=Homalodisca vitripennis TaxID=197043 RepID=UPI001EEBA975|nr:RNA-binding protein 26 isoform X2 [Homalodisca vitripennis]
MIVGNPEAFKSWMTTILEPLCDADPEALAKYVYALVKKDKPTEELRKSMIAQLEVFLQKDTKDFVDLLFSKLESDAKNDFTFVKIKEEPVDRVEAAKTSIATDQAVSALPLPILPETVPETVQGVVEGAIGSSEVDINPTLEPVPALLPVGIPETTKPIVAVQPAKEQAAEESPKLLRNGSSYGSMSIKQTERRLSSSRSHDRKSDSEREEKVLRRRDSSVSPPLRRLERSRSRSWEPRSMPRRSRSKSRRSRSRGRERDRSRAWRNKSPPPRRVCYDRDRRMRSWSKSPLRSRSRSPPSSKLRARYRNRSPMARSRSRSHSPYDSPRKSLPLSGGGTPTQDSNHGDDLRLSASTHNIQSVVSVKEPLSKIRRCRDFDEKGFCMRGEMCPYDHGKDPVVLEDVGQVLSFSGPNVQGLPPPSLEPPAASINMPMLQPPTLGPMAMHHRPQLMRLPHNLSEYNPDAPSMEPRMWSKHPFRTSGRGMLRGGGVIRSPPGFAPHHQRELISVPVMEGEDVPFYAPVGNPMKRQCPPEFSNDAETIPPLKQRFDYSRLGNRRGNCSLQLKKIPQGLNNIAHLHNHFVKFGKIVNIQVSFEGDPEGALITFTSHAEASAAYKSTEAVLNNRFIKVFWYNPDKDNKQENISPLNRPSAKERLGAPVMNSVLNTPQPPSKPDTNSEMEKVFITGSNITKTVYIPTVLEKKTGVVKPDPKKLVVTTSFHNAQDIQIARESLRKKQEEKRKEAIKLTQHLFKRKTDLIDKFIAHQKVLIEKLEKGNFPPEQRAEIMSTITGFQENIDTMRKDLKTVVTKPTNTTTTLKVSPQMVKRTREEVGETPAATASLSTPHTQKQILDAELDMFNQEQEGKDTSELQKRVLELKNKAHNLGLLANNGVLRLPRNSTRYRTGRGRGGFNPHSTVDHRPTKLLISGFESDDKAEILEHFSKFGEVVDHVWDEATPALVVQFKTRKDAETAMAKGRNFQDRLMTITWFNPAQNMGMRSSGMRSVILLNDSVAELLSEHDDEEEALRINLDSNEDFLLQDEEEEEDEERSWRR